MPVGIHVCLIVVASILLLTAVVMFIVASSSWICSCFALGASSNILLLTAVGHSSFGILHMVDELYHQQELQEQQQHQQTHP